MHWKGGTKEDWEAAALAIIAFMLIYLLIFGSGVVGGLAASEQSRFALSAAAQHLRSAWECVIYALQVW